MSRLERMREYRRHLASVLRPPVPAPPPWHGLAAFGEGSRILEPVREIWNPSGIAIGNHTEIRSHIFLQALSPPGEVVLRIGDHCIIGYFTRMTALGGITIGDRVLIGDHCHLSDTFHNYEDVTRTVEEQGFREGRRIVVEDDAMIGIGAVLVGNIRIGRRAVVGANCVVRGDVEPFTVVAGDPARVVRRYVDGRWETVEGLR